MNINNIIVKKIKRKVKKKLSITYRKVKRIEKKEFYNINIDMNSIIEKESLNNLSLKQKNKIKYSANKIINNELRFLGFHNKIIGDIEWNKDYYYNFDFLEKSNQIKDIKYCWELNRLQHLLTVGQAYYITKEIKYLNYFKSQIESWINQNPFNNSINWTCAMEVGIRAVNLIVVKSFFEDSKELDLDFWMSYNHNMYMHGIYIYDNLEYDSSKEDGRTNHFISNLVGLIFLGIYFKNYNSIFYIDNNQKKWLNFGLKYIENEMKNQVYDDGTSYEDSTNYHRLVTELFLYVKIICLKNNLRLSEYYDKKLRKMCLFARDIMMEGYAPLMGDIDSGRLLIIEDYFDWRTNDFSELIYLYNYIYSEKILINQVKESYIPTLFKCEDKDEIEMKDSKKCYVDGGYYFIKNEYFNIIFKCGKIGFNNKGSHSHNDQLSYCLNILGKSFFIDPGLYTYNESDEKRNYYRKTSNHNVLSINNEEANKFIEADLWNIKHETNSKMELFSEEKIIATHQGYLKSFNVIYKREIELVSLNKLIIKDKLNRRVDTIIYSNIVLDEDVEIIDLQDEGIRLAKENIEIIIKCEKYSIEDIFISNGYGLESKSKKVVIESTNQKDIEYQVIVL